MALCSVAFATTDTTTREMVQLDDSGALAGKVYDLTLSGSNYHLTGGNEAISFTPSSGSSSTLSSYIMTFSFSKLPDSDKDQDACIRTAAGDTTDTLSVVSYTSDSGTLLSLTRGHDHDHDRVFGGTLAVNTTDTFALTVYTTLTTHTLYLSNLSTGDYICVENNDIPSTLTKFDFTSSTARAYSSSGNINLFVGEIADISGLNQEQVANLVKYATTVPEPATVTLSLLALASLCSRRRRRK